jgi:hypothetical protein
VFREVVGSTPAREPIRTSTDHIAVPAPLPIMAWRSHYPTTAPTPGVNGGPQR